MNLRRWDLTSAKRTDLFIANSRTVQDRIRTIYARDSIVIPPPVQEHFFRETLIHSNRSEAPLLAVGRLVPYKRFDLLIELANTLNLPLIIVGKGREELRLKRMAGPTVTFLEHIKDNDLSRLYAQARALLFPQHEDAGIVPLEAQACGTPVIAFQKGGAMEVVRDRETGIFFREQSLASLTDALDRFNRETFDPQTIRNHAQQFSASRFRERIREAIEEAYGKRVAS
jgi:glycosyltransferase involved in cell wall biosynthesis